MSIQRYCTRALDAPSPLAREGGGAARTAAPTFIPRLRRSTCQTADAPHRSRDAFRPGDAYRSRALINDEAQGRPGADRTHGPRATKSTRQNHRYEPNIPAFPARMALRLIRTLPGDRRSCPRRSRAHQEAIASLASAPGGQDHTISPSASCRSSACETHAAPCRGHRIPCPTFVTTRVRPSSGPERAQHTPDFMIFRSDLFSRKGLK